MDKVFYHSTMTKISIIKSSSDNDSKKLFAVSRSSSQKLQSSSDSDNEKEEKIYFDDPKSSGSDTLKRLSYLVCIFCDKRQSQISTDFVLTGWVLCAINHIHRYAKYPSDSDNSKQVNNTIKTFFH